MIKSKIPLLVQKKILLLVNLSVSVIPMVLFAQDEQSQQQVGVQGVQGVQGVSEEQLISSPITRNEADLIQLESTFVGDKEQPSVSYFIPWKGTGSADGLRWQIERKNDDTLNLVDRDIMLRSINIYNEMGLE